MAENRPRVRTTTHTDYAKPIVPWYSIMLPPHGRFELLELVNGTRGRFVKPNLTYRHAMGMLQFNESAQAVTIHSSKGDRTRVLVCYSGIVLASLRVSDAVDVSINILSEDSTMRHR